MIPFYTQQYVAVNSPFLASLYFILGGSIVLYTLFGSLLCQHNYVDRNSPIINVGFWQDRSTDGSWWPKLQASPSAYCGLNFTASYSGDASWGNSNIGCLRAEREETQLFYTSANEARVAFSIADGSDPQYNTSDVHIYEGIEKSTIVFEVSFSTKHETVPHVENCKAFGPHSDLNGKRIDVQSRYLELVPEEDYGKGYLMLSIEDLFMAANISMDQLGSEGAPLRLSGAEIVARINIQNYNVPLAWPFKYNPFGFRSASALDCTVQFDILRSMFNPIQWFYAGKKPIALQHGLRLSVVGTGSIGYPSGQTLLTQLLAGFTMFGVSQSILDLVWYYCDKHSSLIAKKAYTPLDFDEHTEHEKLS